jgi:hypothetical protein
MLTGDKAALPVPGIAVGVVRIAAEHLDPGARQPAHHAVVGNIAPDQIIAIAEIDRPLGPQHPVGDRLEKGIAVDPVAKPVILNFIAAHDGMCPDPPVSP